ncbi:conserved hypothetical protein, partial [Ricinus communis]
MARGNDIRRPSRSRERTERGAARTHAFGARADRRTHVAVARSRAPGPGAAVPPFREPPRNATTFRSRARRPERIGIERGRRQRPCRHACRKHNGRFNKRSARPRPAYGAIPSRATARLSGRIPVDALRALGHAHGSAASRGERQDAARRTTRGTARKPETA